MINAAAIDNIGLRRNSSNTIDMERYTSQKYFMMVSPYGEHRYWKIANSSISYKYRISTVHADPWSNMEMPILHSYRPQIYSDPRIQLQLSQLICIPDILLLMVSLNLHKSFIRRYC